MLNNVNKEREGRNVERVFTIAVVWCEKVVNPKNRSGKGKCGNCGRLRLEG